MVTGRAVHQNGGGEGQVRIFLCPLQSEPEAGTLKKHTHAETEREREKERRETQTHTHTQAHLTGLGSIIGNYYSLKGEHEKAVIYFQRALSLNRHFTPAWILMGHEFMEMKNTSAEPGLLA